MPTYTQETRPIAVTTPLGKDALLLSAFSGVEAMSSLFRYQLDLVAERKDITAKDIVGQKISFHVEFPGGKPRHFNGFVSRFSYSGTGDRLSMYRAEVVPWLWFLTRTSDCRIFQKKTVPQIIDQVFKDLGFTDFKPELQGSHPEREYCVQYRETDFAFVSRLMEEEGIFYYFKHEDGKHTLMLCDSVSSYKDCEDKEVQFAAKLSAPEGTDQIRAWEHQYEFRSGKWAHTDYNFETPSTSLMSNAKGIVSLPGNSKFEFYDYPGEYAVKGDGESLVKLRIEEEESGYDVVRGESICRSFTPGGKFTMKKHHNAAEQGKSYVLTAVRHEATVGATFTGGSEPSEGVYRNSFICIPSSVPFRPERTTPKPAIHGVQTAVVVGPAGEEIYVDKYGRIKVQFHWDREGKKDDNSSCWIRVSQPSAGKGWGVMMLPRIGQEVVVTYLEGDPDRPLITGVVYNAEQMPAYKLPDEKTKSGFKSNSTPGGSGFNEFRMDDTAGKEQIYIHGQYDMDTLIEHDERTNIGNDQSLTIGNDRMETIGNDQHLAVGSNVQQTVGSDLRLTIGSNQDVDVGANRTENIGSNLSLTVGGSVKQEVATDWSLKTNDFHAKMGMGAAIEATDIHLKAAKSIVLEAGVKLSLKVGGNFVDVSVAGVAINGTPVLINSGGAAGAGAGCSPKKPDDVKKAEPKEPVECDKTAKTGQKSAS